MSSPWSLPRRVAFRFAFLYLGLYELPWILKRPFLPGPRPLVESIGSFEPAVRWFGHHVVGIEGALPKEYPAGGDTPFEWVRFAFLLVVATIGAAAWSAVDWKRRAYPGLLDALRTYLRYGLALTMLTYGAIKVLPVQFPPPQLGTLLEPYGDSSPMGLLWTFMGFSHAYAAACGLVEIVGGALLFFRGTTFVGALLLVGAAANVLLLNLFYDVNVKLYAAHLLAMALFLAAPDGGRVILWLARREPVALPPLRAPFAWPALERARPWLKAAVVAWCCFATLCFTVKLGVATARPAPPPLFGAWLVESSDPPAAAPASWHHVVVNEWSEVMVERLDDERVWFACTDDPAASTWELAGKDVHATLAYERPDADHLVLAGDLAGVQTTMRLRRVKKTFPLLTRGFHWMQDEGFNR